MADEPEDPKHAKPEVPLEQGTPPPGNTDGAVPPAPDAEGKHRG
jgi:hypothetical protein